MACTTSLPAIAATRRGGPDSFAGRRARARFRKKKRQSLTAQSIDLRRASDPRIERVADRLGRSALIDQRQRDVRVSGSLYALCVEGKGRLTWIMVTSL